jgi:hypothetical protein
MRELLGNLARTTSASYQLDSHGAALRIVGAYVDDMIGDPALYDDSTDLLTPEGEDLLSAQIQEAAEEGLDNLDDSLVLQALAEAAKEIVERTHERDELIRLAMRADTERARIAAAANLTEARLYQIRDRRR